MGFDPKYDIFSNGPSFTLSIPNCSTRCKKIDWNLHVGYVKLKFGDL